MNETFLQQLRRLSVERAKNGFKTYDNQPITYWTTAIVGELGELCNMIKKMKRAENGGHDSGHSYTAKSITPKMLREEVGGTLIYIDLLCSILGIDLQEAITETFNEKSVELGFPYLLTASTPPVSAMEDGWVKVEDEISAIPIQDALYATGKFTTDDCSMLADGILQYIKDANMSIVNRPLPPPPSK